MFREYNLYFNVIKYNIIIIHRNKKTIYLYIYRNLLKRNNLYNNNIQYFVKDYVYIIIRTCKIHFRTFNITHTYIYETT